MSPFVGEWVSAFVEHLAVAGIIGVRRWLAVVWSTSTAASKAASSGTVVVTSLPPSPSRYDGSIIRIVDDDQPFWSRSNNRPSPHRMLRNYSTGCESG